VADEGPSFLPLTLPTLAENLALDEALLLELEAGTGGEVLRVWEWPKYAVVLGAGCWLSRDADEAACVADGVEVLRRASGGGTVLLGPGCLLYTLVLTYDRDAALREIGSSYRYILKQVAESLDGLLPELGQEGVSDLASRGLKCSGNAQQRKARGLLHHGTLLYDFDLSRVRRYLRPPQRQPEYRGGRDHDHFLTNLPSTPLDLTQRLRKSWAARNPAPRCPEEKVRRLVTEKYSQPTWTRRRA
jgi:lipoate-protein ligase A